MIYPTQSDSGQADTSSSTSSPSGSSGSGTNSGISSAIGKYLGSIVGALGRLIGVQPRGDYQKFLRTLYPYMAAQADLSQCPVYCLWFEGEAIQVRPGGLWMVSFRNVLSLDDYYNRIKELSARDGRLLTVDCGAGISDWGVDPFASGQCRFLELRSGVIQQLGQWLNDAINGGSNPVPVTPGSGGYSPVTPGSGGYSPGVQQADIPWWAAVAAAGALVWYLRR